MPRPEHIIWIFTAQCNLNCLHCYARRFKGLRELSLEEKLRLVKDIGESGVEYVNLTGGEPLVHPHFPSIVAVLHEYGVEKSVVTNATHVDEEVASLLSRTETYVFATIEGPREVHDRIRGRGSYDMAIKGVEVLRRKVGRLSLVATVNKVNYRRVHEVVDYAVSINADSLALLPVMPSGRAVETEIYIGPAEYLEALNNTWLKAKEYGLAISAWCTPWAPLLEKDVGFWLCRNVEGMDVDPEGNVLLCDVLDFRITNVRREGVLKAFEEFVGHELVRKVVNPTNLPESCTKCPIAQECRGGCYARAYVVSGDLNAGDPLCPRIAQMHKASIPT